MKNKKNPNWGGVRENAGRKCKLEEDKAVTLSFSCTLKQKDTIKKLIVESGLTQSEWILTKLL